MQDNKIFKPKEDGGCYEILILKISPRTMTWATSVPILVFLGLSVLELGPMYATDRQTSDKSIA